MITSTDKETKAIVSSQMETAQAQISMTPQMMDLLSSGIYTDKVLAVVRELSCNGLDANTASGSVDPLIVHLPTSYELWFSVKDSGIGLSHEDVMSLYMTYGASTKRQSNDFIGAWGVGSKSPFAYTDAFTVTSCFDGEKRTYSIYKNEGIPNCTLLSTEVTEEPNGLEVKVPVRSYDSYDFRVAAEKVYKGFDVKPETNFEIDTTIEKEFESEDYFLTQGYGNFYVKNGVVIYGLDYDKTYEVTEAIGSDNNYYIEVPVGSVDIAGSREKLQMTDRTKEVIDSLLDKIKNETVERMVADIESKATTLKEFTSLLANKPKGVQNKATFQGKTKKEWMEHYDEIELPIGVEYFIQGWNKIERRMDATGYSFNPLRVQKQTIFVKDLKVGGITEFKEYVESTGTRPFPMFQTEEEAIEFAETMSWESYEIVKASDLKTKVTRSKRQPVQLAVMSKNNRGSSQYRELKDFDVQSVKKDVWFVELFRDGWRENPQDNHANASFYRFNEAIENGLVGSVFFVRSNTMRKLTNPKSKMYNPHFKCFDASKVFGDLTKKEINTLVINKCKNLTNSLRKNEKELASISDIFTKQEKRVLLRSMQQAGEVSRLLTLKLNYSPVAKQTERNIGDSLPNLNEVFNSQMIDKYPFMEMCSKWGNITVDDKMLPYIKHLIEQTDSGVFSNNEERQEDIKQAA